jgi:hypothetical protein
MYSIAYMNLLLIPLIMYGRNNSVIIFLCVLIFIKMHLLYMCIFYSGSITGLCVGSGMLQFGIRAK